MRLVDGFQQVFHYMANQGMKWPEAAAELIDNSFDAGATRVEVRFSSAGSDRYWEIRDDGRGCADINKMLPIGSHHNIGAVKQTVGMYGIGLKDAWAFSGRTIEIETVSRGRRGVLCVNVADVEDLEGPDPSYEDAAGSPTGTRVRLSLDRNRRIPNPDTWDRVEWIFTPALAAGRQITVELSKGKKRPLRAVDMPPFVETVEDDFTVEGKHVSIAIGIVKDGYRMKHGPFWVLYGHRIIRHAAIGSGKFSTLRMGGKITLGEGWKLTKNKDDLSELVDSLDAAIFERIEHLLLKHERLCEDVESAALKTELAAMLNGTIAAAKKEKRNSPQHQTGAVLPVNSGRARRNPSKTQPGNKLGGGGEVKRRGFQIDWMEDDGPTIGEFEPLANVVRLNLCHPFVAAAKSQGNKAALYAVAVTLLSHAVCNSDAKGAPLLFEIGSFGETYAQIMRTMSSTSEGKQDVA